MIEEDAIEHNIRSEAASSTIAHQMILIVRWFAIAAVSTMHGIQKVNSWN